MENLNFLLFLGVARGNVTTPLMQSCSAHVYGTCHGPLSSPMENPLETSISQGNFHTTSHRQGSRYVDSTHTLGACPDLLS
jgi:hypothetical protein